MALRPERQCRICGNSYPYDVVHFVKRRKGFHNVCCDCEHIVEEQLAPKRQPKTPSRIDTKEWQELRQEILERDNYTCTECGKTNTVFHVHHIVEVSQGGTDDPGNLKTLCVKCHYKIHEGTSSGTILLKQHYKYIQEQI